MIYQKTIDIIKTNVPVLKSNGLKITKSDFRSKLTEMIEMKKIA